MITSDDVFKLTQVFATKQDLEKLATKEEFNELKNEVLDKWMQFLGEVKAMREEQTSHFQRHEDIDHQLANHERHLKKLETQTLN